MSTISLCSFINIRGLTVVFHDHVGCFHSERAKIVSDQADTPTTANLAACSCHISQARWAWLMHANPVDAVRTGVFTTLAKRSALTAAHASAATERTGTCTVIFPGLAARATQHMQ